MTRASPPPAGTSHQLGQNSVTETTPASACLSQSELGAAPGGHEAMRLPDMGITVESGNRQIKPPFVSLFALPAALLSGRRTARKGKRRQIFCRDGDVKELRWVPQEMLSPRFPQSKFSRELSKMWPHFRWKGRAP